MIDTDNLRPPAVLPAIEAATQAIGFSMASDRLTGSLLRTLAATRPGGTLLELGTGTGLASAWMLAGMDARSTLVTVDQDGRAVAVAQRWLAADPRIEFRIMDGALFLQSMQGQGAAFDLIFADTWPGKYSHLDDVLRLLKVGGLYVVDDMLPQPNWPAGHAAKVADLIAVLERRDDLHVTKLNWSTGLIVAAKL